MEKARKAKGPHKIKNIGSRKVQIARYYLSTYPQRKLRHLLRHNGVKEAKAWARKHDALVYFYRLTGVAPEEAA